ncbi:MAG: mechanosensitive ion channel family protein, partial [Candidatus Hydrothermarchaeales archaeon]
MIILEYVLAPIDIASPASMIIKFIGVVFLIVLAKFVTRIEGKVVKIVDNAIKSIEFSEKTYHTIRVATEIVVYFVMLIVIFLFLGFKEELILIWQQPNAKRLLGTGAVLLFTWLSAEILRPSVRIIDELFESVHYSEQTHRNLEKVLVYIIWLISLIAVLNLWGVTGAFAAFLTGGAIMGFAIGYAAKDLLANILSGLFVFIDKPFKVGDKVEIGSIVKGKIEGMGLRTTTIRSLDGLYMVIPNQKLAQERIINYSRSIKRRVNLPIGISYDSDIQKAIEVMKEEPLNVEGVEAEKGVTVFLDKFGDYSIDFIVRYWIDTKKRNRFEVLT